MIRRVVFALLVGGVAAQAASAQNPPLPPIYPTPQAPPVRDQADVPPPPPSPAVSTRTPDQAKAAAAKRAITRANPPARRASTGSLSDPIARRDSQASQGQFANPGGVGRYAEYYTSNTPTSQLDLHAMPQARFDRGGGPDRASQIASFRAGQQRTANIQNNINAYGRPYAAYGAGVGFGFGLGYGLYGGGMR
jgi:hypothetical protein